MLDTLLLSKNQPNVSTKNKHMGAPAWAVPTYPITCSIFYLSGYEKSGGNDGFHSGNQIVFLIKE